MKNKAIDNVMNDNTVDDDAEYLDAVNDDAEYLDAENDDADNLNTANDKIRQN